MCLRLIRDVSCTRDSRESIRTFGVDFNIKSTIPGIGILTIKIRRSTAGHIGNYVDIDTTSAYCFSSQVQICVFPQLHDHSTHNWGTGSLLGLYVRLFGSFMITHGNLYAGEHLLVRTNNKIEC